MRFRFTIRDLLWLAVVAALAVGWCLDHQRASELSVEQAGKISSLEQEIKANTLARFEHAVPEPKRLAQPRLRIPIGQPTQ